MSYDDRIVVLHSVRRWLQRTKTWIYEQLRWLPQGVDAHVVCDGTENLSEFPFAHLHVLGAASLSDRVADRLARRAGLPALRFATRLTQRLSAAVLHSHFGQEAWRELGIARESGLPHVVTFYGYDVTRVPASSPVWKSRYQELFDAAALVLCEGPHMRRALIALGADAQRVKVQHLGVDLERISFAPRSWAPGEPLRILMAAAFRQKKGLPYALRALAELLRVRPELDVQVTVVGDASQDAGEQAEKRLIVEAAGLLGPERVRFVGFQPHDRLFELARDHHVFLSPSVVADDGDTEGGAPVGIIELAAAGLAVVSTTHCDIPNVLQGPAAALLASEKDIQGLAQRLDWLTTHRDEWNALVHTVRNDLEQRFDSRRQAQALAEHYRRLAEAATRPSLTLRAIMLAERSAQRLANRRRAMPAS
jgi:colanic acid/amylovoran biosynthesis glycosyltransferase